MQKELFVLPRPISALSAPEFSLLPARTGRLVCSYESPETGEITWISLMFENRYAVKITNAFACDLEILSLAIGKIVDFGDTKWLKQIRNNVLAHKNVRAELKHLGIYFDDDCLYEFICESFSFSTTTDKDSFILSRLQF